MQLQDVAERLFLIAHIAVFIHVPSLAAITAGIMEPYIVIHMLGSGYVSLEKLHVQNPGAMLRPDQEADTAQRMNARREIVTADMRLVASIVQVILLTTGVNHRGVPHHPVVELRLVRQVEDPVAQLLLVSMIHIMFTVIQVHRISLMISMKSFMIMRMITRTKMKRMMPQKTIGETITDDAGKERICLILLT